MPRSGTLSQFLPFPEAKRKVPEGGAAGSTTGHAAKSSWEGGKRAGLAGQGGPAARPSMALAVAPCAKIIYEGTEVATVVPSGAG